MNLNSFDYDALKGHCTLLIASSGSGKTRLIKEILFKLKDDVPSVVLLCPTALQNRDFDGIIPDPAIITNLSGGRIVQKLSRLFKRQEEVVVVYNKVNDISILRDMAEKLDIEDDTIKGLCEIVKEYTKTRD